MPNLTDVIGTILKEITHSRVVSDVFSRDISKEYQQDPILIDFPVPRVEIKQASIQLKFAINKVEREEVDPDDIIRPHVFRRARDLGGLLYDDLVLKHPNREEVVSLLDEKKISLEERLPKEIENTLLTSPVLTESILKGRPEKLVQAVQDKLGQLLREDNDLWNAFKKGMLVRQIEAQLRKRIEGILREFAKNVTDDLATAEQQALKIDIAITRDELSDVTESVMSQIHLITEVRNYELTEVSEIGEEPVRKLRLE